jgi:SAM-dependent methyltransferase
MRSSLTYKHSEVIEQNISYYNEIAEQYDHILDQDKANNLMRKKISSLFCQLVPPGLVLDFGGGTGKDLDWLAGEGYRVIFCEPSIKMREKASHYAQQNLNVHAVRFLHNASADFTSWQTKLPFTEKADAVLSNFAVINCIPGLRLFFTNLSLVVRPGAHLFMLVLKNDFRKRWRTNRLATLLSLLTSKTIHTTIAFNDRSQKIYLYTSRKIKKMAAPFFHFQSLQTFKENGFEWIHFTRK